MSSDKIKQCAASDELLQKITVAAQEADAAEQSVSTAQAELVSRSKAVGLLLLEAKKLHPKGKDFEAFLNRVDGLKRSRAYDLMKLAGGRTTDEELRKDARERQAKSRAKKKKPPVTQTPFENGDVIELEADSFRDVTESAEASAEASAEVRKAEYADADTAEERWQRSLSNLAGDAIALRAFWRKEFGDWEKFKAPSDLITLAKQAADEWAAIASQLDLSIPTFLRRDEAA
jgi:hypothetical protein